MSDNKGMEVRDDLFYSKQHEWVKKLDNNLALFGITDFAQNSLGDIVYAELSAESGTIKRDDSVAVVESAKAASDVYAPISGEILEINKNLELNPEILNNSPYDKAWLFKIKLANAAELKDLMTAEQYKTLIAEA